LSSAKRSDRVSGQIQRELSDLLVTKIQDPRLALVTITRVKISDDLRFATVYASVAHGRERSENMLAGFRSALGFLRRELSRRLGLRYTPELKFVYDESFDRAEALNKILETVRNEMHQTPDKSNEI
jgi:ribosome-binding factor A